MLKTDSGWVAGPWDLITIVQDTNTGRYHLCVFQEAPPPGPYDQTLSFVRLKSMMHHTLGAATFDEALQQLAETRQKIQIADENVCNRPDQVLRHDCSRGFGDVLIVPRWDASAQPELLRAHLS